MIAARLVELIETHARHLTSDVMADLVTNERTPGFRTVGPQELEERIFQIVHHLGNWIGDPRSGMVQAEFSAWGRRRFDQGIPLSEMLYAVILFKQHVARYMVENGLVDTAFLHLDNDYILPMHLSSLQELIVRLNRFFDEALYHLALGYEAEARRASVTARASAHHASPPASLV